MNCFPLGNTESVLEGTCNMSEFWDDRQNLEIGPIRASCWEILRPNNIMHKPQMGLWF